MTSGPALPCPSCKRTLGPESWIDANNGVCFRCKTEFEFFPFPALTAGRAQIAPQAAVLEAESVCFFHPENRAEGICDGCGRLLCPVCTVPFGGQRLCPTCIAATRKTDAAPAVRSRMLYDSTALVAAVLPLLFWPLTLVTAPMVLGLVIYGWRKPGSVTRGPSRWRFVLAALIALVQIAGWATVFTTMWLQPS